MATKQLHVHAPLFCLVLIGACALFLLAPQPVLAAPCSQCDCNSGCSETCSVTIIGPCYQGDPPYCDETTFYRTCGEYTCTTSSGCPDDCEALSCTHNIFGDNNSNTINGTSNRECIYGYDGNDTIDGKAGDDQIWGGNGTDTLYGNSGNDCLYGQGGSDHTDGGTGSDYCEGETEVNCKP